MRNLLIIISIVLALSSCSYFHVHRMDIEQGNVLMPEAVNRIHVGMTQSEVKSILGEPILANVFDPNRLDYVYTFKPGNGRTEEKYITLLFHHDRLAEIKGNLYSEFIR